MIKNKLPNFNYKNSYDGLNLWLGLRLNKSKHFELKYFLAQKAIQNGEFVFEIHS